MSSAAATSFTCTPGKLLNFTAVALNRSPYFSILRGLAFATTHLQPVRPRCQLNRGKLGVGQQPVVSRQLHSKRPILSEQSSRKTARCTCQGTLSALRVPP